MSFSTWRPNSCARSEIRREANLDVETLSWIVLRTRGWCEKRGSRELWRLFDQSNERRRVLRNTNHLNLVAFDPQFRHIGAIGQCPRDRFEHHDARWRRLLAFGQQALGRSAPRGLAEAARGAAVCEPARHFLLLI